jgi:hypothetical protein
LEKGAVLVVQLGPGVPLTPGIPLFASFGRLGRVRASIV